MDEKKVIKQSGNEEKEWSKRTTQLIAIMTLLFAVSATFASLKAGAFSNKAILAQNQASDAWAHYQAKSLKETMYKIQFDQIGQDESKRVVLQDKYTKAAERYASEQDQISAQAKTFEMVRDEAQAVNQRFAEALTFLQIGILLLSLAALCKMLYFCYIGVCVGLFGVYGFVVAFLQNC